MKTLFGPNGEAIVYTDNIELEAEQQIKRFLHSPVAEGSHVRIMPDVYAGSGCVIGFTSRLNDKIIPNFIGSDIGCGVTAIKLRKGNKIDLKSLDSFVRDNIPNGQEIYSDWKFSFPAFKELINVCRNTSQDVDHVMMSLGTLGGGNHFIEANIDENDNIWFIVHTGSRNFGSRIHSYYQTLAKRNTTKDIRKKKVNELKKIYSGYELGEKIRALPNDYVESGMEFLIDTNFDKYIRDMKVAQVYAHYNRNNILSSILSFLKIDCLTQIETAIESNHNYIDTSQNIIRKGAIDASLGKYVIIPLNMRDGSIIGVGKGNPDWNFSAPHGAGRLMSRTKAKERINLEEFKKSMEGIYSTSVNESTIDESPMAYKSSDEIISYLEPTVEIKRHLRPVWNFKASE